VNDWLEEHNVPAETWQAIENMTEDEALGHVLEAAQNWDHEVNEYIFQALSEEEQEGYAEANLRHEKAIEIVTAMIRERRSDAGVREPDQDHHG
jgi:ABC-type nitrate/sulfonate/bicarbonate transport system substrate-binding protein